MTGSRGFYHFMLVAGLMTGCAVPEHAVRAAAPLCPDRLTVEQRAIDPPSGFRPLDREPTHAWTNAEFSDGPPEDMAWLAPDGTRRRGSTVTNAWTFGPTSQGTWLSCAYDGTSIVLTTRLPDRIRHCEVRYDTTMSPPPATAVNCR
jgi:hypothetical protein